MNSLTNKLLPQPTLSFVNLKSGEIMPDIRRQLSDGLWRSFSVENWLANELLTPEMIHKQKNLFRGVMQIPPGTFWDPESRQLRADLYKPSPDAASGLDRYLEIAANYFRGLNARLIGVHLSGGLDSSLIIATLHHLGIPCVAIGGSAATYEFRTERAVQHRMFDYATRGKLIDFDEAPYYSDLSAFPPTQIPDGFFKSYAFSCRLADEFKAAGCDVIIGGQGGDSLFVDGISDFNSLAFNIGDEFRVDSDRDLVYSPRGLRLESFFAHKPLIDFICTERIGQKDDPLKWWARHYFKDILPRELSEYAYFGDFFALTMAGLENSRPEISRMLATAYELSANDVYSPRNVEKFLSQDIFSFEHKDYIKFCSLIATAIWYNSLLSAKIIQ